MSNEPLYYNNFDAAKKYFEVRALAGLVEQSREDNEIQAILKYLIKRLGDSFYKNGSLVSGGGFSRSSANANLLQMQEAEVWHNGIMHTVPAKNITISGAGLENIGVLITESVVTPVDDSDLLDPAIEAPNYGQPGANRLKIEATWERNASGMLVYYNFLDGIQQTQPRVGEIDVVETTLARRTYDESGNYVVAGFEMRTEPLSDSQINLAVGNFRDSIFAGSKAYVRGREIIKLLPDKIPLNKAQDVRTVQDERVFYAPVDPDNPTTSELRFELANQPAARITRVSATFDVVRTINGHNTNSFDEIALPDETLVDVITVFKGGTVSSPAIEYVKSSNGAAGPGDWYKSGTGIRWDVSGSVSEPSPGDTYTVYALLRRTLLVSEYTVSGSTITNVGGKGHLNITPLSTKPYAKNLRTGAITSSDIDIDYEFYLPRIDVITLDANGIVGTVTGISDKAPVAPLASGDVLSLGQVYLAANGDHTQAVVTPFDVKRITFLELRKALNRLERAEYNLAVKDLNDEGLRRAGNAITNLRSILTESFTYTAEDIAKDGEGGQSRIKFVREFTTDGAINVRERELSLPQVEKRKNLVAATTGTTADTTAVGSVTLQRAATPLYYLFEQGIATSTTAINAFSVTKTRPTMVISPTELVGRETDQATITAVDPTNAASVVQNYLADKGTFISNDVAQRNTLGFNKSLITFMPSGSWIWVYGESFPAGTHVDLKFDGRPVRLTASAVVAGSAYPHPVTPSPASTFTGTATADIYPNTSYVITNSKGQFACAIEIPAGVPSGTVSITAESAAGDIAGTEFISEPKTTFSEHGATTLLKPVNNLIDPSVPTLLSSRIKDGSNVTVTNITSATHLYLETVWDRSAGLPDLICSLFSPSVVNPGPSKDRSTFTTDELNTQTVTFDLGTLNQAFDYKIIATNRAGVSNVLNGVLTYAGNVATYSPPNIGSVGTVSVPYVGLSSAPAVVSWSNITGTFDTIKITSSAAPASPVILTGVNATTSGQTSVVVTYGNNLITFEVSGSSGSDVKTVQIRAQAGPEQSSGESMAQTFTAQNDGFVEGVELYFAAKPASGTKNVTVEIRDVQEGIPSGYIVDASSATASVARESIQTSSDALTPTYFKFPAPVYLQTNREYALVVRTDDPAYTVYYAKLGENLVGTSVPLTVQAAQGVMLLSANNSTWTTAQDSDLKFRLKAISFMPESMLYYENIAEPNMVGIHVALSSLNVLLPAKPGTVESACKLAFEYQLDATGPWLPLVPDSYVYFDKLASVVQVRVKLSSSGGDKISPRLPKRGSCVNVLTRGLTTVYMTKTVALPEAYQYVRMLAKQFVPAGATVKWYTSNNAVQPGSVPTWSNATTYSKGNVVLYSGINYESLQNGNINKQPDTQTAWWTPVSFMAGVIWREIPALGEIKTLQPDNLFYEHDRVYDLGVDSGRTSFRMRVDIQVPSTSATIRPPRVRDLIAILTD